MSRLREYVREKTRPKSRFAPDTPIWGGRIMGALPPYPHEGREVRGFTPKTPTNFLKKVGAKTQLNVREKTRPKSRFAPDTPIRGRVWGFAPNPTNFLKKVGAKTFGRLRGQAPLKSPIWNKNSIKLVQIC